jgi:hypothetical protein
MNRKFSTGSQVRNQRGLALWIKIVLGIFVTGFIVACVCGLLVMNVIKDAMDPKKTEAVANQICTFEKPLPAPFEYGRFNLNVGGFVIALVNNTESNALYILMNVPKTEKATDAQSTIDQISKGESLPSVNGAGAASGVKSKMQVESKGTFDVAGKKLYYVLGKAPKSSTGATGAGSKAGDATKTAQAGDAGQTVETFFGAADPQNPKTQTLIMVQQPEVEKHLSLDEIKAFLKTIKSI